MPHETFEQFIDRSQLFPALKYCMNVALLGTCVQLLHCSACAWRARVSLNLASSFDFSYTYHAYVTNYVFFSHKYVALPVARSVISRAHLLSPLPASWTQQRANTAKSIMVTQTLRSKCWMPQCHDCQLETALLHCCIKRMI